MNPRRRSDLQPERRARAISRAMDMAAVGMAFILVALAVALMSSGPVRADDAPVAFDGVPTVEPQDAEQSWHFRVFVDDKEVGYHHFYLDERDGQRLLRSVADFKYKLLFLTVYDYEHENREVWDGDCLDRIDSRTDANGKPYAVQGRRQGGAFVVDGSKGEHTLPGCVMSFAYWNPAFLEASRLLNTQNGEYLDVRVSSPVRDEVEVGGQLQDSLRYRLEAGKLDLQLWYSDEREWLGLETRYENGRTLRYELLTGAEAASGGIAAL